MHQKKSNRHQIPELLLPAGNMENFKAAIAGGADAVYMGIKQFNARGRAQNFSWHQLATALEMAKKHQIKVYVTLNTVIKNSEIDELIETLHALQTLNPDGVIIQDWGVYHLAKKYFPEIVLHASTQMGNHNSLGTQHAKDKGIERVILARELTLMELKSITGQSVVETEIFIHGALCYSFSGMCLFSSFTGGQGANRGLCKQPCRRLFHIPKQTSPFSLKDLQTIDHLAELKKLKIKSLKVEGRLKSANYVYKVAQAYKAALLDNKNIDHAREMLEMDMGRDKTGYFQGGIVKDAITQRTATGLFLNKLQNNKKDHFTIDSPVKLHKGDRLRITHRDGSQTAFKIGEFTISANNYEIKKESQGKYAEGDEVFLASQKEQKIKAIEEPEIKFQIKPLDRQQKQKFIHQIKGKRQNHHRKNRQQIFVRINDLNWIKKVQFNDIEGLFLKLPLNQYKDLRTDVPFIKRNLHKIYIELPGFIPEDGLEKWKEFIASMKKKGIYKFVISHLSQQLLLHMKDQVIANENVYAFNNAAISAIKAENIRLFTYPLENDFDNIKNYTHKDGIMPVYFRPALFFSRMPVQIDTGRSFADDYNPHMALHYAKRDNLNYIYPEQPVSFTHQIKTFEKAGINRFLVDFSYEKPSQNRWKTIIKRVRFSEQVQPAYSFNLKNGLT